MQVGTAFVVGDNRLLRAVEYQPFAFGAGARFGDVVEAEHHVLRGNGDRRSVGRVQDVVRTEHENLRLQNGGIAQRQVYGHLVAVEVGVECRTCQRMELQGLAFDELRLEGLDTEAVQGRGTVHQYRVPFYHIFEDVPDDGVFPVDDFLCRFDGLDNAAFDELADDERLVEFCRHILRNTHLVHLELRAHDDDRTGRVVYALTEEVLAETSLFPLETVAERFQRSVALRFYRVVLARVIEQAVHRLLKHALLVAEDDFRCLDFDEPLEAVVADDNAAVEVVQVGGGETSAVQRDEGPQFRRNDRNDLQHHPFGFVDFARLAERLDDVEPLEGFGLALLRGLRAGLVA